MGKIVLFFFTAVLFFVQDLRAQQDYVVFKKHNPKNDRSLDPYMNARINPDSNYSINPAYNWNISPLHSDELNPFRNTAINPMNNTEVNPQTNELLNPIFMKSLLPANPSWNGLYMFNSNNDVFGFVSLASQNVMISFDNCGTWTGYFVKSGNSSYNYFTVPGIWTGMFLCDDQSSGYNLFDKDGKWTGIHIK